MKQGIKTKKPLVECVKFNWRELMTTKCLYEELIQKERDTRKKMSESDDPLDRELAKYNSYTHDPNLETIAKLDKALDKLEERLEESHDLYSG